MIAEKIRVLIFGSNLQVIFNSFIKQDPESEKRD